MKMRCSSAGCSRLTNCCSWLAGALKAIADVTFSGAGRTVPGGEMAAICSTASRALAAAMIAAMSRWTVEAAAEWAALTKSVI